MKKLLYFILGILIFIFIILIYSRFIGTTSLAINEIVINANIDSGYDGLKIVHFSDLHYKKIITEERIKELVKEINNTNPDLIIFTGDLVDNLYEINNTDINFLIYELNNLEARYGKFAVLGDQDYRQKDIVSNIYIQSNFMLLNNESKIVYNNSDKIMLVGTGSYLEGDFNLDNITSLDNDIYKIFLVHEPDSVLNIKNTYSDVDLILGGHSINGSLNIPLIKKFLLPEGAVKYYEPYYKLDNTDFYISNGIGVNNVNFRLFNKPSFNLYRLNKTE